MKRRKISPFQGRLDFSQSATRASSFAAEHKVENLFLRTLIGTLVLLSCTYTYFVVSSSLAVISANAARAEAIKLEGSVGEAERQYFSMSKEVTPDRAPELGLAPISNVSYVRRPSEAATLSVKNNAL